MTHCPLGLRLVVALLAISLGACAMEDELHTPIVLTPEQTQKLAELGPRVQQGDSVACYDAARIYITARQHDKADQVLRFGAHFHDAKSNEFASLHCVDSLLHLYSTTYINWDQSYEYNMEKLNIANTYLNYLVEHKYTGADPVVERQLKKAGTSWPSGLYFNAERERENLQEMAASAARIHNTNAQGLVEIQSAFNQAVDTVASSAH
jgi:hypothetical protein